MCVLSKWYRNMTICWPVLCNCLNTAVYRTSTTYPAEYPSNPSHLPVLSLLTNHTTRLPPGAMNYPPPLPCAILHSNTGVTTQFTCAARVSRWCVCESVCAETCDSGAKCVLAVFKRGIHFYTLYCWFEGFAHINQLTCLVTASNCLMRMFVVVNFTAVMCFTGVLRSVKCCVPSRC